MFIFLLILEKNDNQNFFQLVFRISISKFLTCLEAFWKNTYWYIWLGCFMPSGILKIIVQFHCPFSEVYWSHKALKLLFELYLLAIPSNPSIWLVEITLTYFLPHPRDKWSHVKNRDIIYCTHYSQIWFAWYLFRMIYSKFFSSLWNRSIKD